MIFSCYVFTDLILHKTSGPSGGPFFRCTTKEWGERRVKGVATPFNPLGLMLTVMPDVLFAYEFAMVRFTRLSRLRRFAYSLASLYCTYCGEIVGTYGITDVLRSWQLGGYRSANLSTAAQAVGTKGRG